ncbi:MAG: hypothetical protein MJZ67_02405 [Bacteroidales bacterium]|nr:hypothetical protein [Bacteroidales bacterium]
MKRIIILALLLLAVLSLSAQTKQHRFILSRDFDRIIVEQGWDAVLVQSGSPNDVSDLIVNGLTDTLNYLTVEYPGSVNPSHIFRLMEGNLRIKENKHLPLGTRVVIHTARRVGRIELKPHAQLSIPGRFEGYGDLVLAQWSQSRLVADTLASASLIFGYYGDSCHFSCRHQESIQTLIDQNHGHRLGSTPSPIGQKPDSNQYSLSSYNGSVYRMTDLWDEPADVRFYEHITLHIGLGFRLLHNICENEVYNSQFDYYASKKNDFFVPLYLKYKIDRRWEARVGLQYNWFTTTLFKHPIPSHDLNQNEIDPNYFNAKSTIDQHFLGVPLSITYHPLRRNRQALGLTAGLLISHHLAPATLSNTYQLSATSGGGNGQSIEANPWRIELQLGAETNMLGLIHGVQFFYSLLPSYLVIPGASRCHEFGFALFL